MTACKVAVAIGWSLAFVGALLYSLVVPALRDRIDELEDDNRKLRGWGGSDRQASVEPRAVTRTGPH